MAANGTIALAWGDAEHTFCIAKIGQALELEEKCGVGVAEIYTRVRAGAWKLNDLRETLRLGLIGGGMKPVPALVLVQRYFDARPWAESHQTALAILMAAIVGVPGDDVGKETADQTETEVAVALSDPPSTAREPPQDLTPDKSTG